MPDPAYAIRRCAICEKESHQLVMQSDPDDAAPDFDTRPGGGERAAIASWVEHCPHCGYCAEQISFAAPEAAAAIQAEDYQQALSDSGIPEPARRFLAFSVLLEELGAFAVAGHIALWCAWLCDDLESPHAAVRCRLRTLNLWREGRQHHQEFGDDIWEEFGLAIDVLRRAGRIEEAREACESALDMDNVPLSFEILYRRQKSLIEKRDTARHSMAELPPPPQGGRRVVLQ